jgi:hypothetical protein
LSELVVSGRLRAHAYWQVVPEEGGLVFLPLIPGGETW